MKHLFLLLILSSSLAAFSQDSTATAIDTTDIPEVFVDVRPEYPGGEKAMEDEIRRHVRYPEEEKQQAKGGTVYIEFIVEKDGSMSNLKVTRGVPDEPAFEAAALEAYKKLEKKFSPAVHNGKTVRYKMILPLKFFAW